MIISKAKKKIDNIVAKFALIEKSLSKNIKN